MRDDGEIGEVESVWGEGGGIATWVTERDEIRVEGEGGVRDRNER